MLVLTGMIGGPLSAVRADEAWQGWRDPCRADNAERARAIHALYERRDQTPIWLTRDGTTDAGQRLVRLLRSSRADVMTDCLAEGLSDRDGRYARGALDVMLTDAWVELLADHDDPATDPLAALSPGEQTRRHRVLDRLAGEDAEPDRTAGLDGDADERLAAALKRYRRIADQGGWPEIAAGAVLKPGASDSRVPALRERLAATGDLGEASENGGDDRYDRALVEAVTRFQERHGLEPDGILGEATRRALDVPARGRARQIQTNLRRIEANAIDEDGPLVRVNIPDYRVMVVDDGRVTFSTRAIVGRPEHPTPQLQGQITALTLNPAWNVPRTVLREKLAARFARDEGYAERHGFHAVNDDRPLDEFDWRETPMVPVRQAPGPTNALGRIKFEMPNRQAIYLHDTPSEHLFSSRERAFSAGCVRVEEPMELAAHLTGLDAERLEEMARDGETRTVALGWRIPVQLVYITAWVDTSGSVQFRPDIYGRDEAERTERSD